MTIRTLSPRLVLGAWLALGAAALLAGCVASTADPAPRPTPGGDSGRPPGADAGPDNPAPDVGGPDAALPPPGAKVLSWTHHQRVLVLLYDPIDEANGDRPVREVRGWADPRAQAAQYAADMEEASGGSVTYEQVGWQELDEYPLKQTGFRYDDASYQACLDAPGLCHQPDAVDYGRIISDHDLCGRVERGEIDEVWAFGGPYFGFYESTMAGDGAFWVNSPAVPGVRCARRFIIMGFNYERGVAEMLHDFGHRVESTMQEVFRGWPAEAGPDPYARFRMGELNNPGQARCGDTHFPANAELAYDYSNQRPVASSCAAYLDYPLLQRPPETITCAAWGCEHRQYMMWMFAHIPRNPGASAGYHHNWWKYLVDFDSYLSGCGQHLAEGPCGAAACRWHDCGQCGAPDSLPEQLCGPDWQQPPPDCAPLGAAACQAHGERCLWYDCAASCWPHGTPLAQVCPPPAVDGACDTLDSLHACDARAQDCAWYACVSGCLPRGTPVEQVCGGEGPPACTSLGTLQACDAEPERCAWYQCAEQCHPRGTPAEQVCPEGPPACTSLRTLQSCDAESERCAWYQCAEQCHPRGTPAEQVCPEGPPACTSLRTLQSCDAESERCAWYLCADECHPRGTPAERVCPEGPPACTSLRSLQACDAEAARCAWYLCAEECHPRGTPAERVCPDHNPCAIYRDLETCDQHAAECAWYLCADECHPRGTPAEDVCGAP